MSGASVNSAAKSSVSLGTSLGQSHKAGQVGSSLFGHPTSSLQREVQHAGQSWPCARLPTTLYHTELAHELPAGRLQDLAAFKMTTCDGGIDRAQHPSPTAPSRHLK